MVRGIESFRDWFYGYENAYALAGEGACDLLMSERGLDSGGAKERGGAEEPLQVPKRVRTDMMEFLKRMESENVSLRRLGIIGVTREEVTEELREVFADGDE